MFCSMKSYIFLFWMMHDVNADTVTVMEGDSVKLKTDFKTNQRDRIRWYFSDTRIAQISGDPSKICTDVQCNEGTERFRGRLKLDETGSLTITNIRTTDSGEYHQEAVISGRVSEKIFNVTITGRHGSEAVQTQRQMEMEGASDTLDNAKRTSPLDQDSGYLGVTIGVTLLLVMVVGAGAGIYYLRRNHKPERQNNRIPDDVRDGLTQDKKNKSEDV